MIGTYCRLYKTCVDCNKELSYKQFGSKGKGRRREYCKKCGKLRRMNPDKTKSTPTLKEGSDINVRFRLANNKRIGYKVSYEKALQLVESGMALIVHETLIHKLYNKETFRQLIFERDNFICVYCGKPGTTVDHIIPKGQNGLTTPENCVCCCKRCNKIKSNILLDDFLFYYEPYKERSNITIEQYLKQVMNRLIERLDDISEGINIYSSFVTEHHKELLLDTVQELERSVNKLKLQLILEQEMQEIIEV